MIVECVDLWWWWWWCNDEKSKSFQRWQIICMMFSNNASIQQFPNNYYSHVVVCIIIFAHHYYTPSVILFANVMKQRSRYFALSLSLIISVLLQYCIYIGNNVGTQSMALFYSPLDTQMHITAMFSRLFLRHQPSSLESDNYPISRCEQYHLECVHTRRTTNRSFACIVYWIECIEIISLFSLPIHNNNNNNNIFYPPAHSLLIYTSSLYSTNSPPPDIMCMYCYQLSYSTIIFRRQ